MELDTDRHAERSTTVQTEGYMGFSRGRGMKTLHALQRGQAVSSHSDHMLPLRLQRAKLNQIHIGKHVYNAVAKSHWTGSSSRYTRKHYFLSHALKAGALSSCPSCMVSAFSPTCNASLSSCQSASPRHHYDSTLSGITGILLGQVRSSASGQTRVAGGTAAIMQT